jgi:hypothetical protein
MNPTAVLGRKFRVAALRARDAVATLRNEGPGAALRYGAGVVRAVVHPTPAPRRTNPVDEEFGTDTAQSAKLHDLDISGPNYRYGVYYQATRFGTLQEVLGRLPVEPSSCTFIDFGSGKGLVVLKAAAYPFKKVMGVEFARELHETAQRNVAMYPPELRRAEIELVHMDVMEFEPPPGDLVVYLFEPFEAPLTKRLLSRMDQLRHGRQLIVAYVWSRNSRLSSKPLWDGAAFLTHCDHGEGWTIYRASRPAD